MNNTNKDNPDYTFISGVGFSVFIVYAYFLYIDDQLGFFAAGCFFILYVAEHLFKFISSTEGDLSQFKDSNLLRPVTFALPSAVILLTWLLSFAI
ncbi:MAG: hypothetical protein HRU20_13960 [Pseudomonadales bacterium]|nr:hypothetical protein [Pseudomonadales bacterium]